MSKRVIKTEGGETISLSGQKKKLCGCGRPATRYCDFPRYGMLSGTIDRETGRIASVGQHTTVLCAKPLCDQCTVEQPNDKDFCYQHSQQLKRMIESANSFEPDYQAVQKGDKDRELEELIRCSNTSICNCEHCCEMFKLHGGGFCDEHREKANQILEYLKGLDAK